MEMTKDERADAVSAQTEKMGRDSSNRFRPVFLCALVVLLCCGWGIFLKYCFQGYQEVSRYELALRAEAVGDLETAIAQLEELLTEDANSEAALSRLSQLLSMRQPEQAAEYLRRAARLNPGQPEYRRRLQELERENAAKTER